MIDLYCERLAPGLGGEPLNALTNLGFLCAALLCMRAAARRHQVDSAVMATVLFAIGVGSTMFHTFATRWAEWLDVIPIVVFELIFLGCYLRRLCGWRSSSTALALGAFVVSLVVAACLPPWLNGSLGYVPAALVVLALGVDYAGRETRYGVLAAGGLFVLSLLARSVDNALCPWWPYGTHFAWHLLNALVLYLLLRAFIDSRRYQPAA